MPGPCGFNAVKVALALLSFALMTRGVLACKKSIIKAAAPKPHPVYEGCYVDKRVPRDLPTLAGYNPDMKRELCETWCRKYQAKYFGLQEGISCWCGQEFGKHGKAEEVMCSTRCVGERKDRCGGLLHNSVYKIVY
ncbi:hypothetical protein BOX15_Mlig019494g2 [Macrostomum lignano]|uniref:WSC domain-containing protein n=2 Tax=Macrostomum lignano TaxID=282301 RepID=A0A1I8G7G8_9PLAT|nr:hypothetical protein BOX15_Mlig019494g3 [Macrostomum lignano]PAA48876.1 hypothetical protein BOX15_Mlig019711g1 [Macrostomum lignano]PAA66269.1 hypothetical protein BOX15_Mlig019494g1 [Macrostomum lignano]PAA85444.1 hypothetical protein BOX15_Mlig019494g2 [Macrostomum lignano]